MYPSLPWVFVPGGLSLVLGLAPIPAEASGGACLGPEQSQAVDQADCGPGPFRCLGWASQSISLGIYVSENKVKTQGPT